MNLRVVAFALGRLCLILAASLAAPLLFALLAPGRPLLPPAHAPFVPPETGGLLVALLLSLALGVLLERASEGARDLQHAKEGFAIVAFGWLLLTALGAIPFFFWFLRDPAAPGGCCAIRAATDAWFETMSGFTTTGSTILRDIEALPRSLLLWRALTHWLGGMGMITLALAVFPALGVSGYQMFKGEVPGPTADRLRPRLAETAKILWGVYLLLTLAQTALLMAGGMDAFESLCHAFATLATGGFSTRNASIAAYGSAYIDWVVIAFMYLAGVNFLLHYRALRLRFDAHRGDDEFRLYTAVVLCASLLCAGTLLYRGISPAETARASWRSAPMEEAAFAAHLSREAGKVATAEGALRHSFFQVLSVTTTTGFATADFDLWPATLRFLLIALMFLGGCAGSTGGGIKMVRALITWKAILRTLRTVAQPRLVRSVKVNGRPMEDRDVAHIVVFVALTGALLFGATFLMTFFVDDLLTAGTAVVATLFNIGPGLSGVGAIENFAYLPLPAKWLLSFCMLVGRLELFTVLVFLLPSVWRK